MWVSSVELFKRVIGKWSSKKSNKWRVIFKRLTSYISTFEDAFSFCAPFHPISTSEDTFSFCAPTDSDIDFRRCIFILRADWPDIDFRRCIWIPRSDSSDIDFRRCIFICAATQPMFGSCSDTTSAFASCNTRLITVASQILFNYGVYRNCWLFSSRKKRHLCRKIASCFAAFP